MAHLSATEKALARKAGFRRKYPKKPKRSASLATLQNYETRCREYVSAAKAKISEYKKKEALKKKIFR